jgi:hypothetical protein
MDNFNSPSVTCSELLANVVTSRVIWGVGNTDVEVGVIDAGAFVEIALVGTVVKVGIFGVGETKDTQPSNANRASVKMAIWAM